MFAGMSLGAILLTIGITFWKLKMGRKITPYLLLIGACIFVGTAAVRFFSNMLQNMAGWAATVTQRWFTGGATLILLCLSIVVGIYLWHGMHPKKGKFKPSHNAVALAAPVVWVAAGGTSTAVVAWIQQMANTGLVG